MNEMSARGKTHRKIEDPAGPGPGPETEGVLPSYEKQTRPGVDNYLEYFGGMDKSMAQKTALCAAFLSPSGRTADMGSGSGKGSADLAALYPLMEVAGIDVAPEAVDYSRAAYRMPNLRYIQGDISQKIFPDESLDGILNSSVLHHVTSFNGFDIRILDLLLDNQIRALREGGRLIIRDFVVPRGPEQVILELRHDDGDSSGSIDRVSTAAAFELFASTFRSSRNPDGNVPYSRLEPRRQRFNRYLVSARDAAEFLLRKDYRSSQENWDVELLEEYTYMSQAQFIKSMKTRGLRVILASEINNPWIVENRFEGQVFIQDINDRPLPFFPTNFIIVGQKVGEGMGVEMVEEEHQSGVEFSFCHLRCFRNRETRSIFEIIGRPGETVDLTPWYRENGSIYMVVREGYPRPIVNAVSETPNLDGACVAGYLAEPIAAIVAEDRDLEEEKSRTLWERAGIDSSQVVKQGPQTLYFPSAGTLDEIVRACDFEIKPAQIDAEIPGNYSGFSSSGRVVALEARQLLRSCQVGGMFDNRVELNAYRILNREGVGVGPWIGVDISLSEQEMGLLKPKNFRESASGRERDVFEEIGVEERIGFLDLRKGVFVERDSQGRETARRELEYATPARLSDNTVSVIPVINTKAGVFVGLETRDLPVPQIHDGDSRIMVVPAFRLEREVMNLDEAREAAALKMKKWFNAGAKKFRHLGGKYKSSAGCSPETVYPLLMEVDASTALDSCLSWFRLEDLMAGIDRIRDGHTLTCLWRLAHALSKLQ